MKAGEKRLCKQPTGEFVKVKLLYPTVPAGGWMVKQMDSGSVYRVLNSQLDEKVR